MHQIFEFDHSHNYQMNWIDRAERESIVYRDINPLMTCTLGIISLKNRITDEFKHMIELFAQKSIRTIIIGQYWKQNRSTVSMNRMSRSSYSGIE